MADFKIVFDPITNENVGFEPGTSDRRAQALLYLDHQQEDGSNPYANVLREQGFDPEQLLEQERNVYIREKKVEDFASKFGILSGVVEAGASLYGTLATAIPQLIVSGASGTEAALSRTADAAIQGAMETDIRAKTERYRNPDYLYRESLRLQRQGLSLEEAQGELEQRKLEQEREFEAWNAANTPELREAAYQESFAARSASKIKDEITYNPYIGPHSRAAIPSEDPWSIFNPLDPENIKWGPSRTAEIMSTTAAMIAPSLAATAAGTVIGGPVGGAFGLKSTIGRNLIGVGRVLSSKMTFNTLLTGTSFGIHYGSNMEQAEMMNSELSLSERHWRGMLSGGFNVALDRVFFAGLASVTAGKPVLNAVDFAKLSPARQTIQRLAYGEGPGTILRSAGQEFVTEMLQHTSSAIGMGTEWNASQMAFEGVMGAIGGGGSASIGKIAYHGMNRTFFTHEGNLSPQASAMDLFLHRDRGTELQTDESRTLAQKFLSHSLDDHEIAQLTRIDVKGATPADRIKNLRKSFPWIADALERLDPNTSVLRAEFDIGNISAGEIGVMAYQIVTGEAPAEISSPQRMHIENDQEARMAFLKAAESIPYELELVESLVEFQRTFDPQQRATLPQPVAAPMWGMVQEHVLRGTTKKQQQKNLEEGLAAMDVVRRSLLAQAQRDLSASGESISELNLSQWYAEKYQQDVPAFVFTTVEQAMGRYGGQIKGDPNITNRRTDGSRWNRKPAYIVQDSPLAHAIFEGSDDQQIGEPIGTSANNQVHPVIASDGHTYYTRPFLKSGFVPTPETTVGELRSNIIFHAADLDGAFTVTFNADGSQNQQYRTNAELEASFVGDAKTDQQGFARTEQVDARGQGPLFQTTEQQAARPTIESVRVEDVRAFSTQNSEDITNLVLSSSNRPTSAQEASWGVAPRDRVKQGVAAIVARNDRKGEQDETQRSVLFSLQESQENIERKTEAGEPISEEEAMQFAEYAQAAMSDFTESERASVDQIFTGRSKAETKKTRTTHRTNRGESATFDNQGKMVDNDWNLAKGAYVSPGYQINAPEHALVLIKGAADPGTLLHEMAHWLSMNIEPGSSLATVMEHAVHLRTGKRKKVEHFGEKEYEIIASLAENYFARGGDGSAAQRVVGETLAHQLMKATELPFILPDEKAAIYMLFNQSQLEVNNATIVQADEELEAAINDQPLSQFEAIHRLMEEQFSGHFSSLDSHDQYRLDVGALRATFMVDRGAISLQDLETALQQIATLSRKSPQQAFKARLYFRALTNGLTPNELEASVRNFLDSVEVPAPYQSVESFLLATWDTKDSPMQQFAVRSRDANEAPLKGLMQDAIIEHIVYEMEIPGVMTARRPKDATPERAIRSALSAAALDYKINQLQYAEDGETVILAPTIIDPIGYGQEYEGDHDALFQKRTFHGSSSLSIAEHGIDLSLLDSEVGAGDMMEGWGLYTADLIRTIRYYADRAGTIHGEGYMYEMEFQVSPDEFLILSRPLKDQPAFVMDRLKALRKDFGEMPAEVREMITKRLKTGIKTLENRIKKSRERGQESGDKIHTRIANFMDEHLALVFEGQDLNNIIDDPNYTMLGISAALRTLESSYIEPSIKNPYRDNLRMLSTQLNRALVSGNPILTDSETPGMNVYTRLADYYSSQPGVSLEQAQMLASKKLYEFGIKGNKYAEYGSRKPMQRYSEREDGPVHYNYVHFHESNLKALAVKALPDRSGIFDATDVSLHHQHPDQMKKMPILSRIVYEDAGLKRPDPSFATLKGPEFPFEVDYGEHSINLIVDLIKFYDNLPATQGRGEEAAFKALYKAGFDAIKLPEQFRELGQPFQYLGPIRTKTDIRLLVDSGEAVRTLFQKQRPRGKTEEERTFAGTNYRRASASPELAAFLDNNQEALEPMMRDKGMTFEQVESLAMSIVKDKKKVAELIRMPKEQFMVNPEQFLALQAIFYKTSQMLAKDFIELRNMESTVRPEVGEAQFDTVKQAALDRLNRTIETIGSKLSDVTSHAGQTLSFMRLHQAPRMSRLIMDVIRNRSDLPPEVLRALYSIDLNDYTAIINMAADGKLEDNLAEIVEKLRTIDAEQLGTWRGKAIAEAIDTIVSPKASLSKKQHALGLALHAITETSDTVQIGTMMIYSNMLSNLKGRARDIGSNMLRMAIDTGPVEVANVLVEATMSGLGLYGKGYTRKHFLRAIKAPSIKGTKIAVSAAKEALKGVPVHRRRHDYFGDVTPFSRMVDEGSKNFADIINFMILESGQPIKSLALRPMAFVGNVISAIDVFTRIVGQDLYSRQMDSILARHPDPKAFIAAKARERAIIDAGPRASKKRLQALEQFYLDKPRSMFHSFAQEQGAAFSFQERPGPLTRAFNDKVRSIDDALIAAGRAITGRNVIFAPPVKTVGFPFVKTVMNLVKYGLYFQPAVGAPFQAMHSYSRGKSKADIFTDVASTQLLAFLTMGALNWALNRGWLTGDWPEDPGEADQWRREGKQPHSFWIGLDDENGFWMRVPEPLNFMMIPTISFLDQMNRADVDENDTAYVDAFTKAIRNTGQFFTDQTILGQVYQKLTGTQRGSRGGPVGRETTRTLATLAPYSGFTRWISNNLQLSTNRAFMQDNNLTADDYMLLRTDPTSFMRVLLQKAGNNLIDMNGPAMRALGWDSKSSLGHIPGYEEGIPNRFDLFGQDYTSSQLMVDVLEHRLPIQWIPFPFADFLWQQKELAPVEYEWDRIGYYPRVISDSLTVAGVEMELNPSQHRDLATLHGGLIMKHSNRLIKSQGYQRAPQEVQVDIMRRFINNMASLARAQFLRDNPSVTREAIDQKRSEVRARRLEQRARFGGGPEGI